MVVLTKICGVLFSLATLAPAQVHTDGTVTVNTSSFGVPIAELAEILAVGNVTVYAPMLGSFGFLPESRWGQFAVSRIWTAVTERGSRLVTWEGAMPLRLTDNPVTFQAEFLQGGDVVYRYNGMPTNEGTVGVFRDGTAQTIDVATDMTSVTLKYVGDLGDGAGDTDGDGVRPGCFGQSSSFTLFVLYFFRSAYLRRVAMTRRNKT